MGDSIELGFSDLVQLVRDDINDPNGDIGYARAAKIVDRAIAPQIHARLSELLEKKQVIPYAILDDKHHVTDFEVIFVSEIEKMLEELR